MLDDSLNFVEWNGGMHPFVRDLRIVVRTEECRELEGRRLLYQLRNRKKVLCSTKGIILLLVDKPTKFWCNLNNGYN